MYPYISYIIVHYVTFTCTHYFTSSIHRSIHGSTPTTIDYRCISLIYHTWIYQSKHNRSIPYL